MDNLLSGALGGLIGTFISSILSFFIFRAQTRIDSNRILLGDLVLTIQQIYISIQHGAKVSDETIKKLLSFKAIGLKEFSKIITKIGELNTSILSYNSGVLQRLESTTSTQEVASRADAEKRIDELVKLLRKMT